MYYGFVEQRLGLTVSQPSTLWKNDIVLDSPILTEPPDGSAECRFDVKLKWDPVPGATAYILQWCLGGSFTGPTVMAKRLATNEYTLSTSNDIRIGEEIHWRVMALNTTGGVSEKSETRTFKYECPDSSGGGGGGGGGRPTSNNPGGAGPKCKDYAINMKIVGPAITMCCDRIIFKLQMSWDCKDGFGRDLLVLNGVTWSLVQNPADAGNSIESQNAKQATVLASCETSQEVTIKAVASFTDLIIGGVAFCEATYNFFIDCDTGKPEFKPYLNTYPMYSGPGVQTYTDPGYWRDTIAPDESMRSPDSVVGTPVIYGGRPGETTQQDAGTPLGQIDVTKAVAMGPVVKTAEKLYDEVDSGTPSGGCSNPIKLGKPTGEIHEANTHQAFGCGLKLHQQVVTVNNTHLVGNSPNRRGLKEYGLCSLQVDPHCGVFIRDQKVAIKRTDLMGPGLIANGTCGLQVYTGCGLTFESAGDFADPWTLQTIGVSKVKVDNTALAGDALRPDLETCKLHVDPGYCLEIQDDKINVKTTPLYPVGSFWGVVPGSLALEFIDYELKVDIMLQEWRMQRNDCGVLVGPPVAGTQAPLTASIYLPTQDINVGTCLHTSGTELVLPRSTVKVLGVVTPTAEPCTVVGKTCPDDPACEEYGT